MLHCTVASQFDIKILVCAINNGLQMKCEGLAN